MTNVEPRPQPTVYTMCDSRYFVGAVAMINSYLLSGNRAAEIVVLDLGLEADQHEILGERCRIMKRSELPVPLDTHAWYLTPFPAIDASSGPILMIDSDILVTDDLTDLVDAASSGKICVFPDIYPDRHFASWATFFDLQQTLRDDQTYVNAGFVALSGDHHGDLLQRWWEATQALVPLGNPPEAVRFVGQDALNALLQSERPREVTELLPRTSVKYLRAEMSRVSVTDPTRLTCSSDGDQVRVLHSIASPKPWLTTRSQGVRPTAFVRLLRRVLLETDAPIQVRDEDLPRFLRRGFSGSAALYEGYTLDFGIRGVQWVRNRLPGGPRSVIRRS
jgi:lipopolysaccharide biosynthesis glycosyltransferase